jgi:hypothetical protein
MKKKNKKIDINKAKSGDNSLFNLIIPDIYIEETGKNKSNALKSKKPDINKPKNNPSPGINSPENTLKSDINNLSPGINKEESNINSPENTLKSDINGQTVYIPETQKIKRGRGRPKKPLLIGENPKTKRTNQQTGEHTSKKFRFGITKHSPLTRFIKETNHAYSITRNDMIYIYRNIIFGRSLGELRQIMDSEEERDKFPVVVIAIIASILGDIARGNNVNLSRILAFIFPSVDPAAFFDVASPKYEGGYDKIQALEESLRRLEGDDSIQLVDKLMEAQSKPEAVQYEIIE